jgi:predicted N-acetyltransferase YhbS
LIFEKRKCVIISDVTYRGRTPKEDYAQLISFLDTVFFTYDPPETKRDFLNLLPKLYKPEYDPCYNNFIVKEGDEIKGAVGLYYDELMAGGVKLRCGGIGNVAVAEDSRSKGYMIECMNMAMEDMKLSGADYGLLGGQRQRYGYFGFEPAGVSYNFNVNKSNIRHCFGKDAKSGLEVKEVKPGDSRTLALIDEILRKEPFYTIHPPEAMYDILCSWRRKPYAAFSGEEFKGFFTRNYEGRVADFKAASAGDIEKTVLAAFEFLQNDNNQFSVPAFDTAAIDRFTQFAEGWSLHHSKSYVVINFENTVRVLLNVRAASGPINDGELSLYIRGWAGDEKITLRVKNGEAEVSTAKGEVDLEISHHEAIRFLFSLSSSHRRNMTNPAAQWFPLPLYSYDFDTA